MKKSKLIIEYEHDLNLIGIISTDKGYKLAWELNHALGIHLIKQSDLIVGFKNSEEKAFGYYSHQTQLNRLKLFKNRPIDQDAGKYYLIPEFPHYDFIILADMQEYDKAQHLVQSLKSINSIQLAAIIPLEGLKSKSNFIF
jgi:hypothetical protein